MSLHSLTKPPTWAKHAIATPKGWTDPVTGEVLVVIRGLSTTRQTGGLPTLVSVYLDKLFYKVGDVIHVTAQYNEAVTVTGTPQVVLAINGQNRTLNYASGSGSAFIVFNYTVTVSDDAVAGQVSVTSPISLNSGTIKTTDDATKSAPLAFTGDATIAHVVVDVVKVNSVAGITGAYTTGQTITATVTFNKAVTVTGTPQISLAINAANRKLNYASGSGTSALTFTYAAVSGDVATAGQVVVSSPLGLNGGTIVDALGTAATLTFTPPTTSTVTVN